jgi:signal peptidase II
VKALGAERIRLWGRWSLTGLAALAVTAALDQAHKWWMLEVWRLIPGQRHTITPFLDIVFVINPGISYSLLSSLGQLPLIAFAALATIVLVVWMGNVGNAFIAVCLGLIAGGAVGNAIDRLHLGGVADFFSLHWAGFYWYVFNVADVAIVVGVIGLLYESLWSSRNVAKNAE